MSPLLLTLALLAQDAPRHAALHPRAADLYLELPDVPALVEAYDSAPLVRFLREEQVSTLLSGLGLELSPEADVWSWIEAAWPEALFVLDGARSVSVSVLTPEEDGFAGVLLVVDAADDDAASALGELLRSGASETRPLAAELDDAVALQLEGVTIPLWTGRVGTRLLVGGGSVSPTDALAVGADEARSLASHPRLAAARASFAEPLGTTLYWFHQDGHAVETLRALDRTTGLLGGALAQLEYPSGLPLDPFAGAKVTRMQLAAGAFTSESFTPVDGSAPADATPVSAERLASVPVGAMVVWASAFDGPAVARTLRDALTTVAGAEQAELLAPLDELLAPLGPNLLAYAFPLAGLAAPKTYVWVDLSEADGVQERMTSFLDQVGEQVDGLGARTRDYRVKNRETDETLRFPVTTVTVPKELIDLGPLLSVSPTFTVVEDRLLFGLRSTDVKSELKRLYGGQDDAAATSNPFERNGVALPDGATSALMIDWGLQLGTLIDLVTTLGPMFGELPFDPAALPSARLFTDYFPPSLRIERRVEGGLYSSSRAAFGPETWLGLAGAAAYLVGVEEAVVVEPLEAGSEHADGEDPAAGDG